MKVREANHLEHQREPELGQARQPVTVTVNQLSNCAKKFHGENFVTNLKGKAFPAKLSPGEAPPPPPVHPVQGAGGSIW